MVYLIRTAFLDKRFKNVNETRIALLILILGVIFVAVATVAIAAERTNPLVFECLPWRVGQFVEYQIIHIENEGGKNRYKISLVGQETVNGKVYFWEKIDIFENIYYKKGELFKKNITFLALVEPLTTEKFIKDIAQYIQNGFFPKSAVRLKIQLSDGPFLEVNPSLYFSQQGIIEKTPYSHSPDAMGKIDFSRMKFANGGEKITVPAGTLECGHIFVNTDVQKEFFDEGFDLWRSSKVPLLGIVRMEFSKTAYWEKWFYRDGKKKINSMNSFIDYFFHKRILGRTSKDTYTIQLIDYGPKE